MSLWFWKGYKEIFLCYEKNFGSFFTFRFSVLKKKKKTPANADQGSSHTMWRHAKQSKDVGTGIVMARRQPVALERLKTFLVAITQKLRVWHSESESSGSDSGVSSYHCTWCWKKSLPGGQIPCSSGIIVPNGRDKCKVRCHIAGG